MTKCSFRRGDHESDYTTLNKWEARNRYLEGGELAIDDNASEWSMRPVAIGPEDWNFVGSMLAVLMTLITSSTADLVKPWASLRDVLTQMSRGGSPELMLQHMWLTKHSQHCWTIAEYCRILQARTSTLLRRSAFP